MPLAGLADLLERNSANLFVGRETKIDLFRSVLSKRDAPPHLLFVHGVPGVGKTSLLAAWAGIARKAGVHVVLLSARDVVPTEEAVQSAIEEAVRRASPGGIWSLIRDIAERWVLLIDEYQQLAPVDQWLREILLPQLPDTCLIVLGSRSPPDPGWRSNLGWTDAMHVVELEGVSFDATKEYAARRGLSADWPVRIHSFSDGHPFAMSLACDVASRPRSKDTDLSRDPYVIETLARAMLPPMGDAERRALLAASMLRVCTLDSLVALFGAEAGELFSWLGGLDFVSTDSRGVRPSPLLRTIAKVHLARQDATVAAKLGDDLEIFCRGRNGVDFPNSLLDWVYLRREHPLLGVFAPPGIENVAIEPAVAADRQEILALANEQAGPDSAAMVDRLLFASTASTMVCRSGPTLVGFLQILEVSNSNLALAPFCPGLEAAIEIVGDLGSPVLLVPSLTSAVADPFAYASQMALAAHIAQRALHHETAHRLLIAGSKTEIWSHHLAPLGLRRVSGPDSVGSTEGILLYDVPGSDFSILGLEEGTCPLGIQICDRVSFDRPAVEEAVKQALRDFHDLREIERNPLMRTCIVKCLSGKNHSQPRLIDTFREIIKDGAAELASNPRRTKQTEVLEHTYFSPIGSQERVAESLELPMSTYRRHLRSAIAAVSDSIWQRIAKCQDQCAGQRMGGPGRKTPRTCSNRVSVVGDAAHQCQAAFADRPSCRSSSQPEHASPTEPRGRTRFSS